MTSDPNNNGNRKLTDYRLDKLERKTDEIGEDVSGIKDGVARIETRLEMAAPAKQSATLGVGAGAAAVVVGFVEVLKAWFSSGSPKP